MFTLRRAAARVASSRILSVPTPHQPRSITTLSTSFARSSYARTISQTFQRRLASGNPVEGYETEDREKAFESEPIQPETTSAAEFDVSDMQPIEAREVEPPSMRPTRPSGFVRDDERDVSPHKQLYVGNLFFDVTEEDLRKSFSRFGTVVDLKLIKDTHGLSKGFGYVTYLEIDEATAALNELNKSKFEGRMLTVQYSARKDQGLVARDRNKLRDETTSPPSRTLYIGNMSFDLSDQDLSQLFAGIKNVLDVRVAIDRRTGQPRGFAHADFADVESAENAFSKLNNKEIGGRRLRCDYSAPASRVRARSDAR